MSISGLIIPQEADRSVIGNFEETNREARREDDRNLLGDAVLVLTEDIQAIRRPRGDQLINALVGAEAEVAACPAITSPSSSTKR